MKKISNLKFNSFIDALKMNAPIKFPPVRVCFKFIDQSETNTVFNNVPVDNSIIIFPDYFNPGINYDVIHLTIKTF